MQTHIFIHEHGPEHVTVDGSGSAQELMTYSTPLGFATLKTLEHLGLDLKMEEIQASQWPILHLRGNVDTMRSNRQKLESWIGAIVTAAGRQIPEHGHGYFPEEDMRRGLGWLTTRVIPSWPADTTLSSAVRDTIYPFANETNNDGVAYWYEGIPWWRMTEEEYDSYFDRQFADSSGSDIFHLKHFRRRR